MVQPEDCGVIIDCVEISYRTLVWCAVGFK